MASRFDQLSYRKVGHYLFGFVGFSYYMRIFLTPIALLTWANLNHTLCGTDSDPLWLHLGLGKWYYAIGELYLGGACIAFYLINFGICYLLKRVILGDQECSHGLLDGTS